MPSINPCKNESEGQKLFKKFVEDFSSYYLVTNFKKSQFAIKPVFETVTFDTPVLT